MLIGDQVRCNRTTIWDNLNPLIHKQERKIVPVDPQKENQLYPTVGNVNGKSILRWDPVSQCSDDCAMYDDCPYQKKGRCKLEQTYMKKVFEGVDPSSPDGVGDMLNGIERQRVGYHLMPLYHQLIRMKKIAYAVKDITYVNKQGSRSVDPSFKEIREILRCINGELKDLKINEKWEKKYGATGVMDLGTGVGIEELMEKGDKNFYSSLCSEE